MQGEYSWFFNHPYLIQNESNLEPLITCNLKALAGLDGQKTIEHEEYMEVTVIRTVK